MKYIVTIALLLQVGLINAQNQKDSLITNSSLREGEIEIIADQRINQLIQNHINSNTSKQLIEGYRIQIFFASGTNSKKLATDIKANFISKYPNITAYIIYQTPNFKVRVGDFRSKLEATEVLNLIKRDYPGAFISKDEINLPAIGNN
jgi:hypothetical protein